MQFYKRELKTTEIYGIHDIDRKTTVQNRNHHVLKTSERGARGLFTRVQRGQQAKVVEIDSTAGRCKKKKETKKKEKPKMNTNYKASDRLARQSKIKSG